MQAAFPNTPSRDNAEMLTAMGMLAYAASMMTHEALGHGAYCLAVGGHNTMLTAWAETCDVAGGSGIKAAGPAAQAAGGLLAWMALPRLSPNAARLRYYSWLYMTFSLLISSAYVAFSGFTGVGDAAEYITDGHASPAWRIGLVLVGSLAYFVSLRVAALEFNRFAGSDLQHARLFRLVWIPYIAAGIFACCTGAMNRTMVHLAALGFATASTFGAGMGMLWLPAMQRAVIPKRSLPTVYLQWSTAWGIAAAAVLALFLAFIAPGIG